MYLRLLVEDFLPVRAARRSLAVGSSGVRTRCGMGLVLVAI